jgi:hypothetical protein
MELDGAGREIGMYGWRLLLGKKGKEGEPGLLLQGPSEYCWCVFTADCFRYAPTVIFGLMCILNYSVVVTQVVLFILHHCKHVQLQVSEWTSCSF